MKKITFNQLKNILSRNEIDLKIEVWKQEIKENKHKIPVVLKERIRELKQDYKQIKTLNDLIKYYDDNGYHENELYQMIISNLVKVPEDNFK